MAGLDDIYEGLGQATDEFNKNYSWNANTESGSFGWNPSSDTSPALSRTDAGTFDPYTSSGGYKINASNTNQNLGYDYRPQAYEAGYDVIDPRQVSQVAQKNFGGDTMAALKYRYGDDAQFLQDERFKPYDETGMGYFAKPSDASRLGMGGVDASKYPLWQLPDSQPGLLQGALGGDWPLLQIGGAALSGGTSLLGTALSKITGNPLIGTASNLVTGNIGGGMDDLENPFLGDYTDLSGSTPGGDLPGFNIGDAGLSTMGGYKFDPETGQFVQNGGPMSTTSNLLSATAGGGGQFTGGSPVVLPGGASGSTPGSPDDQNKPPVIPGITPAADATGTPATPTPGTPQMTPAPVQQSPFMPPTPTGTPVGGTGAGTPDAPTRPDTPGYAQKAIDAVTKNPLGAAGLGLTAYRAIQQKNQGAAAADQLNKNAAPTADASKELIRQGMAGEVPPAILQQFQKSADQQKEAICSRYAQMGRDPNSDSSAAAEMAKVDEARDAQIANYASQLLNQGLTAAGIANAPQTAAVTAGVNQDKALSESMSSALQNYMMLQALQGRQSGGATP